MKGTMDSYSKIDTHDTESDARYSWYNNQKWDGKLEYEDDNQ